MANNNENVFKRLVKLFNGSVVIRHSEDSMLKVADTDNLQAFGNLRTNFLNNFGYGGFQSTVGHFGTDIYAGALQRQMLYRDYECMSGDTEIPMLDGTIKTMKQLSEEFPTKDTNFYVYSYDNESKSIKIGNAHSVRKTKSEKTYKIVFDDGSFEKATDSHLFMMRDGTYKMVKDLQIGESIMPFYQKRFFKQRYRFVYNFSNGWMSEHRLVVEQFDRKIEDNEIVHHKDFNKENNLPNNLLIMDASEHKSFHCKINNEQLWSTENREIHLEKLRNGIKNRTSYHWNGERSGEKNPFYGKSHSDEWIESRTELLKSYHKSGRINFKNEKNPNYNSNINFDVIFQNCKQQFINTSNIRKYIVCKDLNVDQGLVMNRIKNSGFTNWNLFKKHVKETLNHKIIDIIEQPIEDVFDMTVDTYHNFATTNCFVHNCMEKDSIIGSAIRIYANELTTRNEFGDVITVKTDNHKVKQILQNLFVDIMNVDFNLWSWAYSLCKYGDFFLKLEISEKYGVVNVVPLSPYDITRVEGYDQNNPWATKFIYEGSGLNSVGKREYQNFEIAHFRLLGDTNFLPYGMSVLEPSRRTWKQLMLMIDAMLIHRIMRAPEKRIFKIDVGGIPPKDHEMYIKGIINKIKKTPYLDPKTGEYNLRYNMQNITEDVFMPVRGSDSGTSIDTLPGLEYNAMDDIEFLRGYLLAGLEMPKAFLNFEEGIEGKSGMAGNEVRFARAIDRIQRIMISELTKIAIVHLYTQGFTDEDLIGFELQLTNPSTIYEQEKISLWQEKISLAKDMKDSKMFDEDWIYKNIFNFSDDDIVERRKNVLDDIKRLFRYTQIENEGNDPFVTNQTFGTPHDLVLMQKGKLEGDSKPIDLGNNNFKYDWNSSTDQNKTENKDYDKDYNENQREEPKTKFGQDSHVLGRDPRGADGYANAYNPTTRTPSKPVLSREDFNMLDMKIKTSDMIKSSLMLEDDKRRMEEEMADSSLLTEDTDLSDENTFLNEDNLLNLDE